MRRSIAALLTMLMLTNHAMSQQISAAVPPQISGYGTLAVTNSSVLASTMTVGPNSPAWPAQPGQVFAVNSAGSTGTAFVCPLGGTCSASNGIPVGVGASYGFFKPSANMTLFSTAGATVVFQW